MGILRPAGRAMTLRPPVKNNWSTETHFVSNTIALRAAAYAILGQAPVA
jgi:hypothetical protein